jgi:hypothetical protein
MPERNSEYIARELGTGKSRAKLDEMTYSIANIVIQSKGKQCFCEPKTHYQ